VMGWSCGSALIVTSIPPEQTVQTVALDADCTCSRFIRN
jgi:hypothetical protein